MYIFTDDISAPVLCIGNEDWRITGFVGENDPGTFKTFNTYVHVFYVFNGKYIVLCGYIN